MSDFTEELVMHLPFTMPNGTPLEDYWPCRQLPSGEWAGVRDQMYTGSLVVGIDPCGYRTRFCYASRAEAMRALAGWSGEGDPPGRWIKQKPEERHGPWYADDQDGAP